MTITDFTPSGLQFVHSLLVLAGSLLAASGVALWMVETGPGEGLEATRRRWGEGLRNLAGASWLRIPGCLTGWLASRLDALIRAGFAEADMRVAFGGIFFGLLFVFLPLAAALNALIGGSPFLFLYYLSLLAALAYLNFAGEMGRLRVLNGVAAAYLGISLIVVIPIYVLRSFTDVNINDVFTHGVLKSFLIAVFWYVAAYGAGLMFDAVLRHMGRDPIDSASARFVHGFLAALPVAYVLTFLALLAGHLAVFDQTPFRSWQLVLFGTGITALGLSLTLRLMAATAARGEKGGGGLALAAAYGGGLILAAGLSLVLGVGAYYGTGQALSWAEAGNLLIGLSADGGRVFLGPDFWLMHLTFLPWLAFVGAVFCGFVVKSVFNGFQFLTGPDTAKQPFLVLAVSCAACAVLIWGTAVFV
ncbi:MAG: hypothetical protein CMM60_07305 [Rhodospirillaceae bacterium]|jgi:hypothetical protein|nr:hypothetical protein [Rhodospirillaceae bacterium]|tara:strand:+ start:38 stop:1288 length:1251 start_codon:yes stop_codon:yes gene_type:complete